MATRNLYQESHNIEVAGSNALTLTADTITLAGTVSLSSGTMTDLTVTGELTVNNIISNDSLLSLNSGTGATTIQTAGNTLTLSTTSGGNIVINANGNVDIDSADNISVDAAGNIELDSSGGSVKLEAETSTIINSKTTHTNTVDSGSGASVIKLTDYNIDISAFSANTSIASHGQVNLIPLTMVTIYGTNSTSGATSHVLDVANDWDDTQADGIRIRLRANEPGSTNVWARFTSGTDASQTTRGRIRGSDSDSTVTFQSDTTVGGTDGGGTVGDSGSAVYASGGGDYGEWIELGDIKEWNISDAHAKFIEEQAPFFGLPEGHICYVRGNKFYKEGPGTPMVVTKSAFLVGNEVGDMENFIGEIFSFSGQIKVMVSGEVNDGDFLISNGRHYCTAISPQDISFQDYMKVIGTAWSENADGLGKVRCAIGIKNTY